MTITELSQQCPSVTRDYQITRQCLDCFERLSGDSNPLHTDPEYARSHGFAGLVAYGNILNAFVSHFVGMLLPGKVMIQAQDISFHAPAYPYDLLHFEAHCDTVSEAAGVVIYKFKFTRDDGGHRRLIARGHVQVGLLP